jgi:hypothetical protein
VPGPGFAIYTPVRLYRAGRRDATNLQTKSIDCGGHQCDVDEECAFLTHFITCYSVPARYRAARIPVPKETTVSRYRIRRRPLTLGIAGLITIVAALVTWMVAVPANAAVGAGTYTLVNAGSGLCLDLRGSSTATGVQLDQSTCNGGTNQKWTLASVSGGFTVRSASSGLCVGVNGASTSAGKAIEQQSCAGASSQTWTLTASGSNNRVVNANGGKCMNIANNSTAVGALVQTNSCDSVTTKQWTFTTAGATPTPTTASPTPTASPTATATSSPPPGGSIYVAPNGSDSAAGTVSSPTTLTSALSRIGAGGTILMRGGTYNFAQTITIAAGNNGTSSARKTLSAFPGETPVLNFSAQAENSANRGLQLNASFWHVLGIHVEHAGDNGIFVGGSNNILERVATAFNHDTGLQIARMASDTPQSQWPSNNLVISSESHDNADSGGENADGFAAKLTVGTGNVFRYDVSHNNIDDGWDLFTKTDTGAIGPVTIEFSLSYNNGTLSDGSQSGNGDRNGFKLGGDDIAVNHIAQHDIAYHNGHDGFTYNSNPGDMTVSNNVGIDSTERNFHWEAGNSVFRNNTSCRFNVSGTNDKVVGNADSSNQFWTGSNGSRCSSYSGALGWSFASDVHLVVTFGGTPVAL